MIAGEEIAILIEVANRATGMPRGRYQREVLEDLDGVKTLDLALNSLGRRSNVVEVHDSLAAEVIVKLLMIGDVVAVTEEEPVDSASLFQLLDKWLREAGGVDEDVALGALDEIAGGAEARLGVVSRVEHVSIDQGRDGV